MAAVHISPWGLVFQTELSGRCRQTTRINQYHGTDVSSRSQYSAVCITSIDGLMPPDLVTNRSAYANLSTLWNSCVAQLSLIVFGQTAGPPINQLGPYGPWLADDVLGDGPARLSFRTGQWK